MHGAVSDSRSWEGQIKSFSKDFHVVAWDAPGCGQSGDPPENFSLSDYADTLAGLCKSLNIHQAYVLGLSFGGGLAIEFFNRYPDIPKSLLLISAYAGWAGSLPPEELARRVEDVSIQITMDPEDAAELWLPSLFYTNVSEEIIAREKAIIADFHPKGTQIMLEAFAQADLRDVLPKINVPTLLMYGQEDVRAPLWVAQELDAMIPTSKLVILPGVGHSINAEAPEIFERTVKEFLGQIQDGEIQQRVKN